MTRWHCLLTWIGIGVLNSLAPAFDGHKVTEGPLTMIIEEIPTVTQYDAPQEVSVTLRNAADHPLGVTLEMRNLVDLWRAVGAPQQRVTAPAEAEARATFQIAVGRGCHSAHYPVHVNASFEESGQSKTAHAVRIFETDFRQAQQAAAATTELPQVAVPQVGALPLAGVESYRVAWSYYDGPLAYLPVGWRGSEPACRASFSIGQVDRGESRRAIQMHPPYRPSGGTMFAEYRLQLPNTQPLKLVFFHAIRDHHEPEPPSDGVTFRVWVNEQSLFERHTDSKRWVPGEVDLSRFAGQTILLRLESHPGPRRNTVCDQSYWGDPVLLAGPQPLLLSEDEKRQLAQSAAGALTADEPAGDNTFVFRLQDGFRAAVALGRHGLTDATIAFGSADRAVVFDGLRVSVLDQPVGQWPSAILSSGAEANLDGHGRLRIVHRLRMNDEPFELHQELWAEGPGLRLKVACPKRITDLALEPADQTAPRVYYGHGFCIVEPQAFRAGAGGHNLSTSHVGFDFARGVSLLMACDAPPDRLEVDPAQCLYTLRSHPDTTFTFVPGGRGAMDCALRYRPLFDKPPSEAVARKAGRFCFDIWGGSYADDTALVRRCFEYGLTDSLVIMHVWQRWGYDYRLPDIYPPDPKLGTLEELQALAGLCAEHDVPFGLHDNYIDFYPDAEDFSYEHIVFTASGEPQKAWINTGRDAQSYRWRPDRIQPFVQRNLRLIQPNLQPTAYFIDVFTSINSFDYYDRQGEFHSKLETRRAWGEAFAWIRNTLGGHAPMCSEAGGDHLIGYVDGADCQFLQIGRRPQRFQITIPCRDWERVPWFDAVNHTRLSLHGVGYSGRYQGGRSRPLHGIESDDYLSAEILTGHALMIDRAGLVRGAVRKYWLAQDLIRALASDEIQDFAFADGDIHRAIVTWKSGARVYVNRSENDWAVAGRILPPFGYCAKAGEIESSSERIDGVVVEQSRGPGRFYVNGRGYWPDAPLSIRPSAASLDYLGQRRFKLLVDWEAKETAPKDLHVFMHFFQPQVSRLKLTGFYGGGGKPQPPTSRWQGQVTTGDGWIMTLPEDCPAGRYDILVGLYDPTARGQRYRLLGDEDPERRYRVGTLDVEGAGQDVTGMRLEKPTSVSPLLSRLERNTRPIDFGVAKTTGAFRCGVEDDRVVITPLPDSEAFALTLRLETIPRRITHIRGVHAIDAHGRKTRAVDFRADGPQLSFMTDKQDFAYLVECQP
jgi:hypothetical protein